MADQQVCNNIGQMQYNWQAFGVQDTRVYMNSVLCEQTWVNEQRAL